MDPKNFADLPVATPEFRSGTSSSRTWTNTKNTTVLFQPRGAQIEALYALEDSRAGGASRGLVQAATGVGKTYLAAFDSAKYERVLFVAHREEILKQAARSFENVRHSDDYGFFYGKQKDTDKSVIFASVTTLGRGEYLKEEYFKEDYFDYVVIDEFHHAVNAQYKRIVNYFKPKFLLGLTATPERMDGKNIYEICDYNVPYEISLKEAINKGMLAPFHYYGIYDETDYSGLHLMKGRYDGQELTELYRENSRRYDLICKYYRKYRSCQALGFCCSRQHAEEMAREFCSRGIPSAAVYSNGEGKFAEDRDIVVKRLKNGDIKVIFSVTGESAYPYIDADYPDDCIVDFDMRLIDLFETLRKKSLSIREQIRREYDRIKELLDGKVPTRMELFTYMEDEVYQYCIKTPKENPFRRYLEFLHDLGELSADEEALYHGIGREFISIIETTDMQKAYKMPILYSLYNHGNIRLEVTEEEVLQSWKEFFDRGTNWKDLVKDKSCDTYKSMTDKQHLSKAKSMPIHYLKASGKGFFIEQEGYAIAIRQDLKDILENKALGQHMGDVLDYRTMEYYRRRYTDKV